MTTDKALDKIMDIIATVHPDPISQEVRGSIEEVLEELETTAFDDGISGAHEMM